MFKKYNWSQQIQNGAECIICYYSIPMALLHYLFKHFFYDDNEIEGLFDQGMLPHHQNFWFDRWFDCLYNTQLVMCYVPLCIWVGTHVIYRITLYDNHRGRYTIEESMKLNEKNEAKS